MPSDKHFEGELYRVLEAFGKHFEIRYGFYEDFERGSSEPIPIYPDFANEPQYTPDGSPFVTQMQDMCPHATFRAEGLTDECCGNCSHFRAGTELIGKCVCPFNRTTKEII